MTTANITRDELQKLHVRLSETARQIMAGKNLDYAKDTDPLRNFRMFEEFGIVVRLSDKVARLRTFCERGVLDVKDESVEDTLVDVINYAVLFAAYLQDRKPPTPANVVKFPVNEPIDYARYCGEPGCNNLADFRDAKGQFSIPFYYCSNCISERGLDTTDMTMMESVA